MISKEIIQDEYAVKNGFLNWEDLIYMTIVDNSEVSACDSIIEHINAVNDLMQKELLSVVESNLSFKLSMSDNKKISQLDVSKSILNTPIL